MNKAVYHRTSWLPLALSLAGVLIAVAMIGPNVKAQCDPNPGGGPLPPCDPDGNYCSPIIIDISGSGFHLTDAQGGVSFDMEGNGKPIQLAWTARGALNAFLALDRNGNGTQWQGTLRELHATDVFIDAKWFCRSCRVR